MRTKPAHQRLYHPEDEDFEEYETAFNGAMDNV